jgi:intercellular adhesin biosynthesis polysaccharide N-deacetylase
LKNKIIFWIFAISFAATLMVKIFSLAFENNTNNDVYETIPKEDVCVVLTYHRVRDRNLWNQAIEKLTNNKELSSYSVYTDEFQNHIDYLYESGAYFTTPEELETFRQSGNFPDKCVLICFDDADVSVYENAFPILQEKNIPFTLFVIAGQVDNKDFNNLEIASWEQLRTMKDSGLANFGSHTCDMHYLEDNQAGFLEEGMYEEFKIDIEKSREVIKEELGVAVTSLAYPFGEASEVVADSVKEAGFNSAFILSPHPVDTISNAYYQCRYLVGRDNFYKIVVPWIE